MEQANQKFEFGKEKPMMAEKKLPVDEQETQELDLDDLEQVTGGGAFDNVPRVPQHDIDDSLREKI